MESEFPPPPDFGNIIVMYLPLLFAKSETGRDLHCGWGVVVQLDGARSGGW